jgi:single-stranded DNA-binding protein
MPLPKSEIVGNALADAKTGTDKNGRPYLLVRVACSKSHKDDQGNWVTDGELFVNVSWFNARTDGHVPMKGDRVIAFGELSESKDTGKDGTEYRNFNLRADVLRSFEKRQQSGGWNQGGQQQGYGQQQSGGFPGADEPAPF